MGLLKRVCLSNFLLSVLSIKAGVPLLITQFTFVWSSLQVVWSPLCCMQWISVSEKDLRGFSLFFFSMLKIINLGDRDLHQPDRFTDIFRAKMSPFPVKEKNRTALECGASSVNTQLSILCGENWVYKWLSCANFSVGYSNLPLNAVIYFHWFPAVMDFAWTTSLYLTLRMKHMSAYVHLCRTKHTRRHTHTLHYDNDCLTYYFFSLKAHFV